MVTAVWNEESWLCHGSLDRKIKAQQNHWAFHEEAAKLSQEVRCSGAACVDIHAMSSVTSHVAASLN